jgi:hypothetical protein
VEGESGTSIRDGRGLVRLSEPFGSLRRNANLGLLISNAGINGNLNEADIVFFSVYSKY